MKNTPKIKHIMTGYDDDENEPMPVLSESMEQNIRHLDDTAEEIFFYDFFHGHLEILNKTLLKE